jgi:hypothetical protein
MFLDRVTITGADDGIDPTELMRIAEAYPFVEWALLFSSDRQGQARYPSIEWMDKYREACRDNGWQVMTAAHLCGRYVRQLVEHAKWELPYKEFFSDFNRIQLNMTDHHFMSLDLQSMYNVTHSLPMQFILQTKRAFARCDEIRCLPRRFSMLYDVSGGRGQLPKTWASPPDGLFCGLAGGLNPENVVEELKKMETVVGDRTIWIDTESGVRDQEDKFVLDKVERFLQAVAPWVISRMQLQRKE